jgi:hypothetical protein
MLCVCWETLRQAQGERVLLGDLCKPNLAAPSRSEHGAVRKTDVPSIPQGGRMGHFIPNEMLCVFWVTLNQAQGERVLLDNLCKPNLAAPSRSEHGAVRKANVPSIPQGGSGEPLHPEWDVVCVLGDP